MIIGKIKGKRIKEEEEEEEEELANRICWKTFCLMPPTVPGLKRISIMRGESPCRFPAFESILTHYPNI
jgi:hypothetical protein